MSKQKVNIKTTYLWKVFFIVPIAFLFQIDALLTAGGVDSSVGEMLAYALFGDAMIGDIRIFILLMDRMYYIFIFIMLYGTYIYRDFQVSSVYLFSRLKDRKKWFYKNVVAVAIFAAVYTFLFLATLLATCVWSSNYPLDIESVKMLGTLFIFVTLFLTATTLLTNFLTIRYNSSIGFICVYTLILILISIVVMSDNNMIWLAEHPYFSLLNPVEAIILNMSEDSWMKLIATIYYLVLNGVIIWLGARYVNSLEVGLMQKENDG